MIDFTLTHTLRVLTLNLVKAHSRVLPAADAEVVVAESSGRFPGFLGLLPLLLSSGASGMSELLSQPSSVDVRSTSSSARLTIPLTALGNGALKETDRDRDHGSSLRGVP